MASEVMTSEEFRAHIKRMVTWMEVTEQSYAGSGWAKPKDSQIFERRCPNCGWSLEDETN